MEFQYVSPEKRKEDKTLLENTINSCINKYKPILGEKLDVCVTTKYDEITSNYKQGIIISSEKLRYSFLNWFPKKDELNSFSVVVIKEGEGVGTAITDFSLDLAKSLDAKVLVYKEVINRNSSLWKNRPYVNFKNADGIVNL